VTQRTHDVALVVVGTDDDAEAKRRKAYGRGFYEAARAAGLDPGDLMNEAKIQRQEQALTAIEQKVYYAIPTEEAWSRHQIIGEAFKRTGAHLDARVVDGCIADLLDRKLIVAEGERLRRVAPKARVVVTPKPNGPVEQAAPPPVEVPPLPPALEVLSALSADLRALADRFDAAAIGIAGELERNAKEAEKFQQLKGLFGNASS